VSWGDAQAYVAWLNSKLARQTAGPDAKPYRLPSEAEWEYAARAGMQTVRWWGDDIGKNNADCDGCGSRWDNQQPSPVGSFAPNPFGLFDIFGSAWEWTEDCWHKDYVGAPTDGSAWAAGESCGQYYARRGGSYYDRPWLLRPAKRTFHKVDGATNYIGFRVAKTL
jgi:formylglycine-generating enzyme required for sulfatase activity